MRVSTFPLYDRVVDGRLGSILRDYRGQGLSVDEITFRLRLDHDITVSRSTVRRWLDRPEAVA